MLPRRGACVVALACLVVSLSMSPRVCAGAPAQTVVVKNTGAAAVRVRVFTSEEKGCATGHQLFLGTLAAGEGISLEAQAMCVCAEQTYLDSDAAPWTVAERFCRPQICAGYGRAQSCEPGPDPVIRIHVDEKPTT